MYFKRKKEIGKILDRMIQDKYDLDIIKANPNCFNGLITKLDYYQSLNNMFIDEGYYIYDTLKNTVIKCYFKKENNNLYILIYETFYKIYFEIIHNINNMEADVNIDNVFLIQRNKDEMTNVIKEISELVLIHISCINYFATNSDIVHNNLTEKKTVINKSKPSSKNNKHKTKKNNNKKIILTTRVINIPNNINKTEIKRNYTRRTESWKVKGFWRTYKSGKRVWVKPSIRGKKDSNNVNTNIYELKGEITNDIQ